MDRVFLDANVLFSAAYRPGTGLARLWKLPAVEYVTSAFAVEEAKRNLEGPRQRAALRALLERVKVVAEPVRREVDVSLPDKDRPILLAAIEAGANFLLTGDVRHFGRHFGRTIEGVTILPPADFIQRKSRDAGS